MVVVSEWVSEWVKSLSRVWLFAGLHGLLVTFSKGMQKMNKYLDKCFPLQASYVCIKKKKKTLGFIEKPKKSFESPR